MYLGGTFAGEIPLPFSNIIGGGRHAVGGTEFQEFLAVPMADSASDNVFAVGMTHKFAKNIIKEKYPGISLGKGDEGAWVIPGKNEDALDILDKASDMVQKEIGVEVRTAIDVAASEFFNDGYYHYRDRKLSSDKQIDYIEKLVGEYNIYAIEDPLDEDDFDGFSKITERIGNKTLIVGDDIFTTNATRLSKGIDENAANAILIKPNQIGTLTDMDETIRLATRNGYELVVSHRSGETTDNAISHIAVAYGALGLKCGAVGGERIAKLNELIRIEEDFM